MMLSSHSAFSQNTSLKVKINNVKNNEGQVGVLIFQEEKGYPGDFKKALHREFSSIYNGMAEVVFEGLPHGNYVVTVMHDENGNGKFDKDILGRPKEGYGVSNNPPPRTFGPPKFEEGVILLNSDTHLIEIELLYND
jgi:uncharacterized protein (DUF2141 family)